MHAVRAYNGAESPAGFKDHGKDAILLVTQVQRTNDTWTK
jgi:hypothetical protein